MSGYNVEGDFRYFNDAAYRKEIDKKRAQEPTMSDMEPHSFETNCSTDTIQRIADNKYHYTVKFLPTSDHDYSRIGGVAPEDVDKIIEKQELLQLFFSPLTFEYKTKWADFPEIQMLACGCEL